MLLAVEVERKLKDAKPHRDQARSEKMKKRGWADFFPSCLAGCLSFPRDTTLRSCCFPFFTRTIAIHPLPVAFS